MGSAMLQQPNKFFAKEAGKMYWWVELGYPPFAPGKCGFPRTGEVIKHYREQTKDDTGKVWTQKALADWLDITEKAVWEIEKRDVSVSFDRRQLLSELFSIPPVLLGITTAADIEKLLAEHRAKSAPALTSHTGSVDIEEHQQYLTACRQNHKAYTAHSTMTSVSACMDALYRELPHSKDAQPRFQELLCNYHMFVGAELLKDLQRYDEALLQMDKAEFFAETLNKTELKAVVLYRRGCILNDAERFDEATQAFGKARAHEKGVPDYLLAPILWYGGIADANTAKTEAKKKAAIALIDRAGNIVRVAQNRQSPYSLDFNLERYHINKAVSLIAVGWNKSALEELQNISDDPRYPRRSAYSNILQAQAYYNRGMYGMAVASAQAGLVVAQDLDSAVNIARVEKIYQQLRESSYKNDDGVAGLEHLLWPK
jgi:tetratricopeptide (TPR) repeat protein